MRVIITKHAQNRYIQYTGRQVNKYKLRTRLKIKLVAGAKVINGRVTFLAGDGLQAVCAPVTAGWVIITFLKIDTVQRVKIK